MGYWVMLAAMALGAQGQAPEPAPAPERIRAVTVYGDEECPKPVGDETVVCGRLSESDRYRIPEQFRDDGDGKDPPVTGQRRAEVMNDVNRVGAPGSCSAVGTFGQSGCTSAYLRAWQQGRAEEQAKAARVP